MVAAAGEGETMKVARDEKFCSSCSSLRRSTLLDLLIRATIDLPGASVPVLVKNLLDLKHLLRQLLQNLIRPELMRKKENRRRKTRRPMQDISMRKRRSRFYIELVRVERWSIRTWIAVRKLRIDGKSNGCA